MDPTCCVATKAFCFQTKLFVPLQESNPNSYACVNGDPAPTNPAMSPPPFPPPKLQTARTRPTEVCAVNPLSAAEQDNQSYASIDDEKGRELETTLSLTCTARRVDIYNYTPEQTEADEYDYESPYWEPADKKTELLNQFEKLKIPSVSEEDIE